MKRLLSLAVLTITIVFMPSSTLAISMDGNGLSTWIEKDGVTNQNGNSSEITFDTHQLFESTIGDYYSRLQADYTQSVGGETMSHSISLNRSGGLR